MNPFKLFTREFEGSQYSCVAVYTPDNSSIVPCTSILVLGQQPGEVIGFARYRPELLDLLNYMSQNSFSELSMEEFLGKAITQFQGDSLIGDIVRNANPEKVVDGTLRFQV